MILQIGSEILFPATAFLAMAIEAIQQQHEGLTGVVPQTSIHGVRLRDIKFHRALPFQSESDVRIRLTLRPRTGDKSVWHEYNVASFVLERWQEHSSGLVRLAHAEEAARCTSHGRRSEISLRRSLTSCCRCGRRRGSSLGTTRSRGSLVQGDA